MSCKKKDRPAPPEPTSEEPYRLYAHPLLLAQLQELEQEVERLWAKDPLSYKRKNATKRLTMITKLVFELIPADPTRTEYRQGHTLGATHTHWFRAKFFQQYRLFFRYDQAKRVIIYVWVNDDQTLRAYGSPTDAYAVFRIMLGQGHPPNSWEALLEAAQMMDTGNKDDDANS